VRSQAGREARSEGGRAAAHTTQQHAIGYNSLTFHSAEYACCSLAWSLGLAAAATTTALSHAAGDAATPALALWLVRSFSGRAQFGRPVASVSRQLFSFVRPPPACCILTPQNRSLGSLLS